ncbi:mycofactocin biosynthesis peptidyl-dipeptidase MftE [Desertimonas flava]|uniref:mycofactocin biosynthesis peptidyl-dipeptidase MftE n=1 Tax=Desertimonas flava TaxID=2064846 RepID=UPI000E353403|nr:mycofactocin biosynthesis peptidyl-dipeptidase MftE [Desertimonas flava]
MKLVERSSADVASRPPVLAIPVGSCEQHGPHLPLGTDTMIAEALAERLAERIPEILVGPTITVSASGEHAGFPGTLSLGTEVTTMVLIELARSADWAAGLVLVNGHGGNAAAVQRAVATIEAEGRRVVSWWPQIAGGDAHAGTVETSLMLALRPELVVTDRLEMGNTESLAALAPQLRAGGVAAVSANGVLGDPRDATLSAGTSLLDKITVDLVATVEEAIRVDWPLPPR